MNTGLRMKDAPMSLLTLRFRGDMEQAFLDDYFPKSLMQLRVAMVVGLLLFASYGILDVIIVPENKKVVAWIIRYGIVTPVALVLFLFTYARLFKHVMQVALTFLVLFVAAAVTAITVIAYPPGNHFHFVSLMLVIMFAHTFVKLRFLYATAASCGIIALYEIAALWFAPAPLPTVLKMNLLFISASFIGMVSSYQLEFSARKNFVQTKMVQELQEKKHQTESEKLQAAVDAATASLRESELKFRTLAETTAAAIFIHRGKKLLYMNPAGEEIAGYTHEELLAIDQFDLIHPDYRQLVMERVQSRLRGENVPRQYEVKVVTKEGGERWALLCAGVIEYEEEPAIIGTVFDISDMKQAEEEKAALCEENIRHCTTILEEEKKHIREKEEILRDLHDGLGSIITNISLLSEMAQTASDRSAVKNTLQTIASLSREALSEVRSFVQSLDSKETSWQALLAEFRHHGSVMIEPHGMSFAMESSVDAPHEQVNPRLYMNLFRIFKEAITNTIKHSRAQAVHVAMHVDRAGVQLAIRDNGVGMGERQGSGRGVLNMKKRVEEVGGSWSLVVDNGTHISLAVPLPQKYPGRGMEGQ